MKPLLKKLSSRFGGSPNRSRKPKQPLRRSGPKSRDRLQRIER